jgi:type II secretory pathway component PulF
MKFLYKAKNKDGQIKAGLVVASDQERAEQLLAENSLVIISLEEQQEDFLAKINPFGKSISNKDLVLFSRQLATLVSARVPILQALRILEERVTNKYLISIFRYLIQSVEKRES